MARVSVIRSKLQVEDERYDTAAQCACLPACLPVVWLFLYNQHWSVWGGTPHTLLSVPSFSLVTTEGGTERERG